MVAMVIKTYPWFHLFLSVFDFVTWHSDSLSLKKQFKYCSKVDITDTVKITTTKIM